MESFQAKELSFLLQSSLPWMMMISAIMVLLVSSANAQQYLLPNTTPRLTDLFPRLSFNQDFSVFFGASNAHTYSNGSLASITLTKVSGSGLASRNKYQYGFFSAAMKLPPGYTSGVVVAFIYKVVECGYLPSQPRRDRLRVARAREAQGLDSSQLTNIFLVVCMCCRYLVDNIPIREVTHTEAISSAYPSKPMSVYATIWDGSEWATRGGKYPVNYEYAPFVASLGKMEISGCTYNLNSNTTCSKSSTSPSSLDPVEGQQFVSLSQQQKQGLQWARRTRMTYSYCKDNRRFKVLPPECKINRD